MEDKDKTFMIDQNKTDDTKEVIYYTLIGKQNRLDENKNPVLDKESSLSYAKKVITNNKVKYYIKTGIYGKIYNPIGLYSEGTSHKFLTRAGKKAWEYKEVNSKVFDTYVTFLKTKNIAWLNNAERELN